ncbi:unnamed protein product [Orchesella dallaii]|uniref:RanBP-type and C3HC4-type zinc finger-containing protein 1 n=1 Tax=Orchesella dallaii TaxID=48710 RepID=A0ABP1QLJ9_9HEXA
MDCSKCKVNVEEVGGTQMNGCRHFLCSDCIVEVVKNSNGLETGITCGCQDGNITLEELEFMVPAHVFGDYLDRISEENARKNGFVTRNASNSPELPDALKSLHLGAVSLEYQRSIDSKKPFESHDMHLKNENLESAGDGDYGWSHVASLFKQLMAEGMSYHEATDYVDSMPILENVRPISCAICMEDEIQVGQGVILKECFHHFCKTCLAAYIETTNSAEVKCPFLEDGYVCTEHLKPNEIKQLVSREEYERHFDNLALKEAEESLSNVFHCLTPDCKGFCIADPSARRFHCPVCNAANCLKCKVIHADSCSQYWRGVEMAEYRRHEHSVDEANRMEQIRNDLLSSEEIQVPYVFLIIFIIFCVFNLP